MKDFKFNIQRFAATITDGKISIPAGETFTLDGVTYTAGTDGAVLNATTTESGDTFTATAVTGIDSGNVTATASGSDATITFDASDGAIDFTATSDGSVITVTTAPTFEFISGNFTFKGRSIAIDAGAVLAVLTERGGYSMRNDIYYKYGEGATFTFTDTAFIADGGHSHVIYTFTNGSDVRTLELDGYGKTITNYAERGFTLAKGSNMALTIGGYTLTATALEDAGVNFELTANGLTLVPNSNGGVLNMVLSRGDTPILAGELICTSGSITLGYDNAITFDKDTSFNLTQGDYVLTATTTDTATIGVALQDNKLVFTPGTNDGGLNVLLTRGGTPVFGGELNVTGGSISFDPTTQKFSFTEGTEVSIAIGGSNPQEFGFKVTGGDASFKAVADGAGNFVITPDEGDGSLDIMLKQGGTTVFYNNISISGGSIVIGNMGQTIGLTKGTTVNVTLGNYTISATADADASFQLDIQSDGAIAITPTEGDGKLDIAISRDGTQIFNNTVSVNSGTITFNPATQAITLKDGTEISVSFGDYELVATAKGDATSVMSLTGNGIEIKPNSGDGTLDLTLKTASGSINANIEVLSGSFILGQGGALTVTKGTELQIDFGDGYIVNFKATDEAGGSLSLGADGITFTPGSDDGGLELSITRDGETRTASLDVTGGSVTYKLDGSISLTQGTVVKNIFADGNILTITANTDASGKIYFTPEGGLTITPETSDAITLEFDSPDGYAKFILDEITGSVTYSGGTLTLSDGASFSGVVSYNHGGHTLNGFSIGSAGGNSEIVFGNSMTFTPASGATITMLNSATGHGWSVSNGTLALTSIDGELFYTLTPDAKVTAAIPGVKYLLEKAGNYNLNGMTVTTTEDNVQVQLGGDYDTIAFANDAPIKISSGEKAFMISESDGIIQASTKISDSLEVTGGELSFDNTTKTLSATAGTSVTFTQGDNIITFTAPQEISATYKLDDGIYYFGLDSDAAARVSVTNGNTAVFSGELTAGGVLSYNPATGTFGLTGANSSHGDGTNTYTEFTNSDGYSLRMATNDTTVVFVPKLTDGKLVVDFPNERKHELLFTLGKDGNTILQSQAVINGTVGFDIASQELSLTKGTVVTLVGDGENALELTALDDASGQLTFTSDGIKFAPNSGDGQLELNFVATGRKANIDVSAGAIILKNDGTLALEKDTVVNLTWEDGTTLKLTASDTGGSIGFDAQGLKISSDGELSIDLTAGDLHTTLSNLEGTIHYNAGKVLFDENATLTATSTLGGQPVNITLDSKGTGGYLEISAVGTRYVAGTGGMSITWSRDGKSSTFTVSNGSVYIGHGIFQIAEGTELSTDLKDLVPSLYFTTTDAGTYTINGQTITTAATNIPMTATDDYMTFKTTDDVVAYDGMTFTGNGNVSLSPANVVLGAGVVANGFGEGKSFVLAEAGNVTADAKIFQLDPLTLDDGREIPMIITVTGAQDGFVFSRTLTEESEEYLGYPDSPYVGSLFEEKFIAAGDSSYRIRTDPIGLEDVIGISDGATITGGATLDDEDTLSYYVLVTDTTGNFTIGEKTYTLADGTKLGTGIRARFDPGVAPHADKINDLNGTVSGNFTGNTVSINGGNVPIKIYGDTSIGISADGSDVELFGLSDGANLADTGGAKKAHTDTDGAFIFGEGEGDSIGVTVQGDDNVTFEFNTETQYVTNIANIEGNLIFSDTSNMCSVNGIGGVFSGEFASLGATADLLYVYGVADGSELITGDADKIWLQQLGDFKLNDNDLTLNGDDDGIWLRDKEVVGLDEGASLTVSEAGNYSVNNQTFTATAGTTFVGLDDGNDAYIYDANNPLLTKNSSTDEIVAMFPAAENVSIVGASAAGNVPVSLTGGDLAVVEKTNAQVSISAGNFDTVVSKGGNVELNLRGGKTDIFALDGRMSLTGNYDASNDTGFGTTFKDALTALTNGQLSYSNGELKIGSAQVYFGTNSELVNIFDRNSTQQKVGFAEHDASINAGNLTDNLILHGDDYTTLIAGTGNDTILADAGSSIDGGEGSNYIELASSRDTQKAGAVVNVDKGNNTVTNFRAGFGYNADFVAKSDDDWDSSFDGTNVSIKTAAGTTVLQNVGNGETFAKVKTYEAGVEYNVAIVQANSVAAGSEIANTYVGDYSGVDFTGFDGLLLANLHEESAGKAGNEAIYFYGINSLTAGDGQNTLSGSEFVETLSGGKGNSSLWTDAGNDVMIGGDGTDEFFFLAGDGRDVVKNFDFDTDAINILTNEATDATVDTNGNVVLQINHGDDDLLTIENAAGKNFKINNLVMNVDRNVTFNDAANCFVATGEDATFTVTESAEIWMDNTHGKFYIGDIKTINATTATGEMKLAGNDLDNNIIAGNGDTSLWGGNGGNDVLVGGFGRNDFFYAYGNGSDEVLGTNDGDVVNLAGMTLEQISSSEITSDGVTLNFTDGGKLFVNGTNAVNFQVNGETYAANHDSGSWQKK